MQYFLLASLLASSVTAIPLNINLGAYSPALVVGDGEISFGGNQDVTNLMNALEGAAVGGAAANGAKAPATPAAATPAPAPAAPAPVAAETAQITGLQGMGKEISPRIVKFASEVSRQVRRDITGFNAALKYAADALKTSPKIELGTEAAGVGILQSAGISAPQPAAAAAPKKVVAKRDAPKFKTTVTTMLVRGGPTARRAARSIEDNAVEKRSPVVDAVNLNIAEGKIAELTFVETRSAGDDEDEDDE